VTLPDFLHKLAKGLRENTELDQDLVAILESHLINAEPNDKSGVAAANAIEKLAIQRAEGNHA
jgi:hypothetical protein